MPAATRKSKPTYRAGDNQAGKTCTMCGQKIARGQVIQFSKDGISRNHPVPRHVRCPQAPVTIRYVTVE